MRDLTLFAVTTVPLQTAKGLCWHIPMRPPRGGSQSRARLGRSTCYFCPMEPHCRDAVGGYNFIACETPLLKEVLDYETLSKMR